MALACISECPMARGLSGGSSDTDTSAAQCCIHDQLPLKLAEYFGYSTFRFGQEDAILAVLHKNDVFVRIATGAGKSLCMFLPPLVKSSMSLAVIISPLISLMDDQISKLTKCHLSAIRACGSSKELFDDVKRAKYRFVFMSPETATSHPWRQLYSMRSFIRKLTLIAVDEAHCIAEWGKDFRKSFASVGDLLALSQVPIMCLTASAPANIKLQIVEALHLSDPVYVKGSLNRPNVFYSVCKKSSLESDLAGVAEILTRDDPISIPIFFGTKKHVIQAYLFLQNKAYHKHYVGAYHASLTKDTRDFVFNQFTRSSTEMRCVCSTIAFGIGVDIPDISASLVYWVPETLAQFYQLSGRAGRNGAPSLSILYCNSKQLKSRSDEKLKEFCDGKENCRRTHMLRALGDTHTIHSDRTTCCDHCNENGVPYETLLLITKKAKRSRQQKGKRSRTFDEGDLKQLEKRLKEERDSIVAQSAGLRMLGSEGVCHSDTLKELIMQAS